MKKIGFVILHYCAIDDTIKCIESIKNKIDTNNYMIAVVDNCSPDKSGMELLKKYSDDKFVTIINSKQNLGFSKGNNLGINYLKEIEDFEFIVVLNNDTYLIQDDFYETIMNEYKISNFDVMGPKIFLPHNKINPININYPNKQNLKKTLIKLKIHLLFSYLGINRIISKNNIINDSNDLVSKRLDNIILHGCCLVFSKKYLDKYLGFEEKTFMFAEEELLYLKIKKNNLISIYNPNLKIFHSEDKSTNASTKTKRKKQIFLYKNLIKANKILLNEIK